MPKAENVSGDASLDTGLERLLAAVEELPLRYAPFYGRLATFWDVNEAEVQATLERCKHPSAFLSTGLPGIRRMAVRAGAGHQGASASLLHLAPGTRFPRHRHQGHEFVMALEGSYRDDRRVVEPGDTQAMPPGSIHALRVGEHSPCVAAVVSRGFAFTSLPLRLVQLLSKSRP